MRFANVELTPESVQAARDWFAQNSLDCIFDAFSPDTKWPVNDPDSYADWRLEQRSKALAGTYDYTLTFLQRAHYIQTGESVALLP